MKCSKCRRTMTILEVLDESVPAGAPWSAEQCEGWWIHMHPSSLAQYFKLLEDELAGLPFGERREREHRKGPIRFRGVAILPVWDVLPGSVRWVRPPSRPASAPSEALRLSLDDSPAHPSP